MVQHLRRPSLYGPDGKRLGYYRFGGANSGWTTTTHGAFQNFLYLGNKALTYTEDRIGSAGNYFPYGNGYNVTGAEVPAFATYVQDESGLLYADQRFYNPGFGRFMTADRSNANVDYANPTSWNRYAYTNGDPVNGMDPTGQDDAVDVGGFFGFSSEDEGGDMGGGDGGNSLLGPDQNGDDQAGNSDPNGAGMGDPGPDAQVPQTDPSTPPTILPDAGPGNDPSRFQAIGAPPFPCMGPLAIGCTVWEGGAIAVGIGGILADIWNNITWTKRLISVKASCSVHQIGTPDHASAGTITAIGVGINFSAARANAYLNAQARTKAKFGLGFHAQHCGYTTVN